MCIEKGTSWSWIEGLWGIPGHEIAPTGGDMTSMTVAQIESTVILFRDFNSSEKLLIKLEHFPTNRDENQTYAKTTTTYIIMGMVIHQE